MSTSLLASLDAVFCWHYKANHKSICTGVIAALEERTIERQQTIGRVLEMLASGERHIHTFLRVSLKHFQVWQPS